MIFIVLPDIPVEDQLLERARYGDNTAVMRIYEAYFDPVYAYIRLRVDDPMMAEDIASDVFIELISSLKKGKAPQTSLRGWLFKVARNKIVDHYGDKKRAPQVELHEWVSAPPEEQPEIQFMRTTAVERSMAAIRQLNPEHQEVLILRFGQGLNLQDTADIMGKSVSAVKSLQFRAVDALRKELMMTGKGDDNVY